MPPRSVHFNGSVNLADAETVMREIAARVPVGLRRIPDGETGDRQQWIFFQLQKLRETPGIEEAEVQAHRADDLVQLPKVRLSPGVDPETIRFLDLGYADAYSRSFETFTRLQGEQTIAADVLFQVEYPTPFASINSWIAREDQPALGRAYGRALFEDLGRLLAQLPHRHIAVQWDVAVEMAILEATEGKALHDVVDRMLECINRVPDDVPVGLHLCYGDYQHRHVIEPQSLAMQVRLANGISMRLQRSLNWIAFTVPQYRRDIDYFGPLRTLQVSPSTELNFALVPYHPAEQEPGTTRDQIRLIDDLVSRESMGAEWGICTECGMGRVEREDVPHLLDLHRELLAEYAR